VADTHAQALLIEREGYLARGLTARAAQVDAQLASLGVAVEAAVDAPDVETAIPAKPACRTRKATA